MIPLPLPLGGAPQDEAPELQVFQLSGTSFVPPLSVFQLSGSSVASLSGAHRFYLRGTSIGTPLPVFLLSGRSVRTLTRFQLHGRSVPATDPFDADQQVAAGHVETV